jgi:hypothetical protein
MAVAIPNFRGVFMRDTLPSKINNFECGIVNLDSSENNGTHWVAYYKNKTHCIYFDSFGLPAPLELEHYFNQPYFYQTFQLQDANDYICGHLCLYVLRGLTKGISFKNIILSLI